MFSGLSEKTEELGTDVTKPMDDLLGKIHGATYNFSNFFENLSNVFDVSGNKQKQTGSLLPVLGIGLLIILIFKK